LEDTIVWDSRAEAKRAAAERMAAYKQNQRDNGLVDDEDVGVQSALQEQKAEMKAERKRTPQSSFEIANSARVEVEQRMQEVKESKSEAKGAKDSDRGSYRLLGDLPSFGKVSKADIKVAINLELPAEGSSKMSSFSTGVKERAFSSHDTSGIPKEFLCAINGHVMKEPVKATTSGVTFEKATIEVWLATRGSICPITNEPLDQSDLKEDDELRSRIMRYQIQQTTFKQTSNPEDDLYDF